MIPKIIHYIHFGGEDKLSEFRKNVCLPSIYKYCNDWEIKVWDENNLDVDMNAYVRDAYKRKQYDYLSDYFRIYLLLLPVFQLDSCRQSNSCSSPCTFRLHRFL